MQSTIGNSIKLSLFGESHGTAIGIVIDGLAPGIKLDTDFIQEQLEKRKPKGKISTQRHEADDFKIVSGYFNGYTTGTPLCLIIENKSQMSRDYEKTKSVMRPSHADYTADAKYMGYQDYRGGGHFSGRITAPLVAAGAIFIQVLRSKGIEIGTHILKCRNEKDKSFSSEESILLKEIREVNAKYFPVIEEKGIEFGAGFAVTEMYGSEANDSFYYENGEVKTKTNNNGGINGGISNSMPLIMKIAVKPTPSIYKEQESVDIAKKENVKFNIEGRHDPAIIHRARVVVDSMTAFGLLDLICMRYGYMWMTDKK